MTQLRILSAADVAAALPMPQAIAGMKEAFAQLSAGQVNVPMRNRIVVPEQQGVALAWAWPSRGGLWRRMGAKSG